MHTHAICTPVLPLLNIYAWAAGQKHQLSGIHVWKSTTHTHIHTHLRTHTYTRTRAPHTQSAHMYILHTYTHMLTHMHALHVINIKYYLGITLKSSTSNFALQCKAIHSTPKKFYDRSITRQMKCLPTT